MTVRKTFDIIMLVPYPIHWHGANRCSRIHGDSSIGYEGHHSFPVYKSVLLRELHEFFEASNDKSGLQLFEGVKVIKNRVFIGVEKR
jgi:hypothetical protein